MTLALHWVLKTCGYLLQPVDLTKKTNHKQAPPQYKAGNMTCLVMYNIRIPNHVKVLTHALENTDVIVFNQGLHQRHLTGPEMSMYFNRLGRFLHHQTHTASKRVIIRSTTTQHFVSINGDGLYELRVKFLKRCARHLTNPLQHPSSHFLRVIAKKFSFQYMDNFPLFYKRGDLVLGPQQGKGVDCTHHCFSPEIIHPEMVLLTELIENF